LLRDGPSGWQFCGGDVLNSGPALIDPVQAPFVFQNKRARPVDIVITEFLHVAFIHLLYGHFRDDKNLLDAGTGDLL
jgi:hypothetical protein